MRFAGIEKLGYFPIPEPMIDWIGQQLVAPSDQPITLIDPCMGEGAALQRLQLALPHNIFFGCEISRVRHAKAVQTLLNSKREGISRLLNGPAEFIETNSSSFSCVYLNPPFDERGKEQNRWLEMTHNWLKTDGWLIFITTETSALRSDTQDLLNRYYEEVQCYRYPAAQRQFNEVVILARRREFTNRRGGGYLYNANTLKTLDLSERLELPLPPCQPTRRYSMSVPDVEETLKTLRTSGVSSNEKWRSATHNVSAQHTWRPLLELSDGHIANLISSGIFDGLAIQDDELGRCLISGYSSKEKGTPSIEHDGDTEITVVREIPVVHLMVMNIDSGDLHEFNSRQPEHMERFIVRHLETLKKTIGYNLRPLFDVPSMLPDYLPNVPNFQAPGVLNGATWLRLNDGRKVQIARRTDSGYLVSDENGQEQPIEHKQVAHIYQNMLPAQIIKAAAMAYALKKETTSVIEIGQMGTGKTSTSSLTLYLYLAKWLEKVKDQTDTSIKIVVVCPGHLVDKWAREAGSNFSRLEIAGRTVQIVIPGRVAHTRTAYHIQNGQAYCSACGTQVRLKMSAEDRLNGCSVHEQLKRLKTLTCANKTCREPLIRTMHDCPIEDIDEAFLQPGLSVIIISKEDAKLGAHWQPAFQVHTSHTRNPQDGQLSTEECVRCPHCGHDQKNKQGDFLHPADIDKKRLFCKGLVQRTKRENGKVVLRRQTVYEWRGTRYSASSLPEGVEARQLVAIEREVPVTEQVPCGKPLFTFTRLTGNSKTPKKAQTFKDWQTGDRTPVKGSARWELAKVIARRHRHQYLLIIDECHQYKSGNSVQGKAIQWLITSARRTIALTGTIFGGKASSLFYLLYRLSPQFRQTFAWDSLEYFIKQFGMNEYITKVKVNQEESYSAYGAHEQTSTRVEEGNGVDPSIVRWLLSIGVFLTLDELGIPLPEKEERFHWIEPEPELASGLHALNRIRSIAAQNAAQGDPSMFSAWMQAALGWPLCPDQDECYLSPDQRKAAAKLREEGNELEAVAYEQKMADHWTHAVPFSPKRPEGLLIEQIADACAEDWQTHGDKAVVYVSGVKRPANKHLYQAMKRRGLKPFILTTPGDQEVGKWCDRADFARCELDERESVIAEALNEKAINVLIVNPPLVATGLDLIAFNRLHFCGLPTYSVYTFEQSMCRLHRPGQQKKVYIDFWVYGSDPKLNKENNQLQALGMAVMSDKVRASAVVTGSIGAGLAALNQTSGDIMSTLRGLLLDQDKAPIDLNTADQQQANHKPAPNERYRWIENEVEHYDDLRILQARPPRIVIKPIVAPPAILLLNALVQPETVNTDMLALLNAPVPAELAYDPLNRLTTPNSKQLSIRNDPFAKVKTPPVKRRRTRLNKAPDCTPELTETLFVYQHVAAGLQIPLL